MPRSPRPWFRFYVEAVHDTKLRRRPVAERWVWVAILAAARHSPTPGVLLVAEREPMSATDVADVAGVPLKTARSAIAAFVRADMLDVDDDGAWVVTNWAGRQFESDDITERTRKHRSNGARRNVPGTAVGTSPETETEIGLPVAANSRLSASDRQQRIDQAAKLIAQRRGAVNGKGNGWVYAAATGIASDHHQTAHRLLSDTPSLTADQLADLLEPPTPPTPGDSTAAAAQATYERNARRAAGDICPDCHGEGLVERDGGYAQCETCHATGVLT